MDLQRMKVFVKANLDVVKIFSQILQSLILGQNIETMGLGIVLFEQISFYLLSELGTSTYVECT